MKRKSFIASALTLGAAFPAIAKATSWEAKNQHIILPPYLKPGASIGITAPAGYISIEDIQPALKKIGEWGYKTIIGKTIGTRLFTFSASDDDRRKDFQEMMDNDGIDAILCARGGYGLMRIINDLNFEKLLRKPKWIIGFSDITVLHCHLNNLGLATIHSKMCNSFPTVWENAEPMQKDTIESINRALRGDKLEYYAPYNPTNKTGAASGILVGGNLKTIESLAGSKSSPDTNGKILFVEDTGEYLYSIDRMFRNLLRSGKFEKLQGLIVGGFKVKTDADTEDFGETVQQIVTNVTKGYSFPIAFDFPVGHQRNNYALKCGVPFTVTITQNGSKLKEME